MLSNKLKTKITIENGVGIFFINLAVSVGLWFLYVMFMFGAQAAPADAISIFIIAKLLDFTVIQSISFGVFCLFSGIISKVSERGFSLLNISIISFLLVSAFYLLWISQIDSKGILLKL